MVDNQLENYSRLEMLKIIWDGEKIAAISFAARPIDEKQLSYNLVIPVLE